jgi:histidyl-tRNA synthetase
MQRDASLIQPITGFPEWLPSERLLEVGFIDTIRRVYESFGFTPIETPAVEKTATLESKGEIHQQIYSLMRPNVPEDADKDTGLSLHQDLTVPLARYVAQHYGKLVFPFRRYQIQKSWRGERAQRGRFREFYQCDIDIIGDSSLDLLADAEMPLVIYEVFKELGLGDFVIRMSNRKILQGLLRHYGVEGDRAEETVRGIDRLPKLRGGWKELSAWLTEELRLGTEVLDCLEGLLAGPEAAVPPLERLKSLAISDETFQLGVSELETVQDLLLTLDLPTGVVEVDLSITRGLDYYTGTVYETFLVGQEKTLGSICSGGRYEDLASHFIDRKLPGVGVSIGLSRLFAALLEMGLVKPGAQTPAQVMVTVPDREYLRDSFQIAGLLRKSGLPVELFAQNLKHDKQLKAAVRKGIPWAVIPWPDRLKESDSVEIRNLVSGEREVVPRALIAGKLKGE